MKKTSPLCIFVVVLWIRILVLFDHVVCLNLIVIAPFYEPHALHKVDYFGHPIYQASTAGQAGKELTCPSVISGMTSVVYLHLHLGRYHSNVGVVSDVSMSNRCIAGTNEASCGKPNVASTRTPSYKLYTRVSNAYVILCSTST